MPEVITKNFDLWTSATKSSSGRSTNGKREAYGINKLRELILELAVRGKLVPQDSNDEPASELLKRTLVEKKRLLEGGVIRETKAPICPPEPPGHELPSSWVWTNLHELGEIGPRNDAADTVEASFIPMQAISEDYGVPVSHEVKPWGEIKSGFTHFREEDVVLAKITPCFQNGKSAVMRGLTNGFGAGTTELHVYRAVDGCTIPEYVLIYLKSPRFIGDGVPRMTGTAGQKRITRDYFAGNHFPLPPHAEQLRIVAKVDELMALCGQLEQQQSNGLETHQALVEVLLARVTRTASPQELNQAWARIANCFDDLFVTQDSIMRLEQAVLELAATGKLVPQHASEEPARVLLERIAKEKAKLSKEGRMRKLEGQQPITDVEKTFCTPCGWEWVRLGDVVEVVRGITFPASEKSRVAQEGRVPCLRTTNVQDRLEWDDMLFVRREFVTRDEQFVRVNDIVMSTANSRELVGKVAIVEEEPKSRTAFGGFLTVLRPVLLDPAFLMILLRTPVNRNALIDSASQTTNIANISLGKLNPLVLAIPPLSEQHRIVSKVNELMAICGGLKARITEAQSTKVHLADAVVERAVA